MFDQDLLIGVVNDVGWGEKVSDQWLEALRRRGVLSCEVDPLRSEAMANIRNLSGLMWRLGNKPPDRLFGETILFTVANSMGIPVYPSVPSYWHYDNKVRQAYLCEALQVPMPKTWIFWRYEDAVQWAETAPLPVVFKLAFGAGSQNVFLLRNKKEIRRIIEAAFRGGIWPQDQLASLVAGRKATLIYRETRRFARRVLDTLVLKAISSPMVREFLDSRPEERYVSFQEYLPGNDWDTRITVIGDKAFGFRRFNRTNDFRASGSGKLDYDPGKIDPAFVAFAFEASKRLEAEVMTFDCLYGANRKPVTCELSYTFLHRAVASCPGHWLEDGTWVEGQRHPADLQVDLFLKRVAMHVEEKQGQTV